MPHSQNLTNFREISTINFTHNSMEDWKSNILQEDEILSRHDNILNYA